MYLSGWCITRIYTSHIGDLTGFGPILLARVPDIPHPIYARDATILTVLTHLMSIRRPCDGGQAVRDGVQNGVKRCKTVYN